jgi:hypothetical protein
MPAAAHAELDYAAHRHQQNRFWGELAQTLRAELDEARECVEDAHARLSVASPHAGRPAMTHRDALLGALIDRIHGEGLSLQRSRQVACNVLLRCRVPVPADEREVRRRGGK